MDDNLRRALQGLADTQKELARLCHEAKTESLALQGAFAALAAEIALEDDEPRRRLNKILAGIQGVGETVAGNANSPHLTATLDQIGAMAEALMPDD